VSQAAPTIAAVIPTYQREKSLGAAIESVFGQTLAPSEVVVVDDGSTDGTPEMLKSFGGALRSFRQPQSGSAAARNRGVAETSADWIAFLDSDDRWEPDHLERIANAVRATNGSADIYFDDTEVAFATFGSHEPQLQSGSLWAMSGFVPQGETDMIADGSSWVLLPTQPMMLQSSVIRRSRYRALGGMRTDLRLRHDTHLFFLLGLRRPVCAVAGTGVRMTGSAGDDRLTHDVTPQSRSYWDETAVLYGDVLRRATPDGQACDVLKERLATARWRLARIDLRERHPRAAAVSLMKTLRTQPSFLPRHIFRSVSDRYAATTNVSGPDA
jgi:hypothetical protein